MIRTQELLCFPRSQAGVIVVLGLLTFGLTGCYTQLQMADSEAPSLRTEQSVDDRQQEREDVIDPDAPLRSLRRATPDSQDDLVSLAKRLQEARADTEISYGEYREGVHFFRTNYPSFYGNYFGDPFYATYDVQYHATARDAWRVGLDVDPHRGFRDMTAFLCAPHGYDPAFGCRSWVYRPSEFFFLPDVFAFSGRLGTRYLSGSLLDPYFRSPGYGDRGRLGFASHGLFGYGGSYYGGSYGAGLYGHAPLRSSTGSAVHSDAEVDGRRGPEPRRKTLGRGGVRAGAEGTADRAANADSRTEQTRFAEGRDRERPARPGRTGSGDGDRSEDDAESADMRGDAIRTPQMPITPVLGGSAGDGALAEVEHTTLETVRVSPPPLNEQNEIETLRTYRALQRIAEKTDGRTVSVEHQEEMSAVVQHLQRMDTYRTEESAGRHRRSGIDRRDSGARRTWGRSSTGREVRSTRDRGSSASGRSRSDRDSGGDSGRDRSRSRSDDSGGR